MNLSETNNTLTSDTVTFVYGVTTLFSLNIFVGLPANVYVVWLICGGGRGTQESFAFNLALFEILFCFSSLYLLLHFLLNVSMDIGIHVLQSTLQLIFISRPVFQSCICLERYLAVVHPTVFLRFKPLRYRLACCVVNWLLILLYSIMSGFTLSTIYLVYLLIGMSMFFLVIMSYCCVHVLCVLKQPGPGDGDREHENRNSLKTKAFKVIMITLVFTSTSQFLRVFLLGPTLLHGSWEAILLALLLSSISGFITPLLYLYRAGKLACITF